MSKAVAIHFVIATTFIVSRASTQQSSTRELQFQTQKAYAVSIGSDLLVISKNETHIRVDSSDKNHSTCQLLVDAAEHEIPGKVKATVLDSQKIVVYGVHNESEKLMIKTVFHTILIVDPWRCELKTLQGLINDKVPLFFPTIPAEISARPNNQFDIFYLGPKECAPCRFDDQGRRIELKNQLKADIKTPVDFRVRQFGKNGETAYALLLQNGSMVLRLLDQNFNVIHQFSMNNSLFDFSASPSNVEKSLVGATYNTPDNPYDFFYTLFNSNLQPIFKNHMDAVHADHIGLNVYLNIDSKGKTFIAFQQMSQEVGDSVVTFMSYDAIGKKIGSSFELAKIPNDAAYETQTLLVDDREYCLVLHKIDEPYGETTIKCIDVTKK